MGKKLDAKENLELFDKFRVEAIDTMGDAIRYTKLLMGDSDFGYCGSKGLEKLEYSQHILQDNTLPVSLLAAFQRGKSTTTVAMADGHEIIPCGKGGGGIRTSAISVTIYNDKTGTDVKLHTYSKQALTEHVIECCGSHLDDISALSYDLDDERDRSILRNAVKAEIEEYKKDNNYDVEKLAVLRSAILIVHYYGCDSYLKLIQGKFKTLEDIQPFIAFTSDLETRWSKLREHGYQIVNCKGTDGKLLFGELESLYVFVEDVVVPVHSEFMGETGTAVIDAPGTMASNEDTERALRAAGNAAVILFILDGETQLSDEDKKMLRKLSNAGLAEKVVFVVNFHKNPEVIQDEGGIEQSILASIQEAGYCAPHQRKLLYYNAFLAVRAAQGTLILNNRMDVLTQEAIIADARKRKIKFTTLEEAWKKTTLKVLRAIDAEDEADELTELGLCEQTIERIAQASNWKNMITALREHVMNNRVSGVLRDLGVQPAVRALEEIEQTLMEKENVVQMRVEHAEADYQDAKVLLEQFSEEVDDLVDNNFGMGIDKVLAEDYFNHVILKAVENAAKEAAPKIFDLTGFIGNVKDIADKAGRFGAKVVNKVGEIFTGEKLLNEKDPNGIKEKSAAIIQQELQSAMAELGTKWGSTIEYSSEYNENVKKKVEYVQRNMIKTWKKLGLEENSMLSNIVPVPEGICGIMSKDAVNVDVRNIITNTAIAFGTGTGAAIKGLLVSAGTYIGIAWIYIYILPMDFFIPGFAEILMMVSAFVAALVYAVSAGQKQKKMEQIERDIVSKMRSRIVEEQFTIKSNIIEGDMDKNPPEPGVSVYREFYVSLFKGIVEQQRLELEAIYEDRLEILSKTVDQRNKIAEKAHIWRTERIEPLRKKMDVMLSEINEIWP
uniref:hypothetical protein n=1 Tax=Agathobacter sp. TaxID=2021311 RepID=UPI004056424D